MELIGAAIVGALAVLVGPSVLGGVTAILRPAAKGVIKGGMAAYETVAGAAAGVSESMGDLVAEAKAETAPAQGDASRATRARGK
jgi:hypothetical protein